MGGASVILRDRMITEASLPIRSEHSYCNDVSDPLRLPHIKLEDGQSTGHGMGRVMDRAGQVVGRERMG